MLFPRSYVWTPVQRWLIVGAVILGVAALSAGVYTYERYYRGPGDEIIFGTWEETGMDYTVHYSLRADHSFDIISPDAPEGAMILLQGRWYAGGRFVYLRPFPREPDRPNIIIWRIEDLSSTELRFRYNAGDSIYMLKKIRTRSPRASNPYEECQR